jgi:hypothetical protein
MKQFIIGISTAALLAATPALAQTTNDPAKPSTEIQKSAPATEVDKSKPTTVQTPADKMTKSNTTAQEDVTKTFRASKLIGSKVVNAKNESIGDINDLIIGSDGNVAEVIVGVGGFLGLGERNVALKLSELDLNMKNSGSIVVSTSMTKEQLEGLPVWKKDAMTK